MAFWRAVLMLAGVVLHAVMGLENIPVLGAIPLISHAFRMGSFMLISGLLCGYALARRSSPLAWLGLRSVQIGVPLLVGLLVICPLIGMMFGDQPDRLGWPFPLAHDWYHLWFLAALLAYAPLSYTLHQFDRRQDVISTIDRLFMKDGASDRRCAQTVILLGAAITCYTLMTVTRTILAGYSGSPYAAALAQVPLIMGYAPFYLLGFLLARSPNLYRTLTVSFQMPTIILLATCGLYAAWFGGLSAMVDPARRMLVSDMVEIIGMSACPPAASVLILRSAGAIRAIPSLVSRLAEASFTIYILHFPIIVVTKIVLMDVAWNPYTEFIIAIAAGSIVAYAAHVLLVERFAVVAFLINGRLPRAVEPVLPVLV
nr:acyltransferase family protein [Sphingomonas sp. CFBP 13728]